MVGSRSDGLWVREVRKLTASGHQVSLISTAYGGWALRKCGRLYSADGARKTSSAT